MLNVKERALRLIELIDEALEIGRIKKEIMERSIRKPLKIRENMFSESRCPLSRRNLERTVLMQM